MSEGKYDAEHDKPRAKMGLLQSLFAALTRKGLTQPGAWSGGKPGVIRTGRHAQAKTVKPESTSAVSSFQSHKVVVFPGQKACNGRRVPLLVDEMPMLASDLPHDVHPRWHRKR